MYSMLSCICKKKKNNNFNKLVNKGTDPRAMGRKDTVGFTECTKILSEKMRMKKISTEICP